MKTPIKTMLKNIPRASSTGGDDVMSDPEYLRKSSALISEALQNGFDVLQLENGDVVVTGTKVVSYQYRWDSKKNKMTKLSEREQKALQKNAKANNASKKKYTKD